MESMARGNQIVSDVLPGSPAARAGLMRGDVLLNIDGAPVLDLVDYEYLTAKRVLTLTYQRGEGGAQAVRVRKGDCEPLGLNFATTLMDRMRTCKNRCLFCFIDQMPQGVRTSLHVKDDDWRMSFIMGNYVTLTNVPKEELDRIIARRVSPLYVSLHATDPDVRRRMMANPGAGEIMEQLIKLRDAGLRFHLQIVLCPGVNDGAVLRQTLSDVETLLPALQSLAVVPVGLTRFRERLYPLRPFTREEAAALIDEIAPIQARCLAQFGTRLAFLSDEWYLTASRNLPAREEYEEYPQLENGVGLLRLFEEEFDEALEMRRPLDAKRTFAAAGGTAAAPFMRTLLTRLTPYGIDVTLFPVENRYFGGNVNVSGLVTGGDLIDTLRGKTDGRTLLIPRSMLRAQENVFLDNVTLPQVEAALGTRVRAFDGGEEFVQCVFEGETI